MTDTPKPTDPCGVCELPIGPAPWNLCFAAPVFRPFIACRRCTEYRRKSRRWPDYHQIAIWWSRLREDAYRATHPPTDSA